MDGQCVLQHEGEENNRRFMDVLQATEYLLKLNPRRGAMLTVYDPLHRVSFRSFL